jgi:hypothetical protein
VGLVHTPVQRKGKTSLESDSWATRNPHSVRNRTLVFSDCRVGFVVRMESRRLRSDDRDMYHLNVDHQSAPSSYVLSTSVPAAVRQSRNTAMLGSKYFNHWFGLTRTYPRLHMHVI